VTFVSGQRVKVTGQIPESQRMHAKSFETARRVGVVKKMSTCGAYVLVSTEGSPKGAWCRVADVQPYKVNHNASATTETRAAS